MNNAMNTNNVSRHETVNYYRAKYEEVLKQRDELLVYKKMYYERAKELERVRRCEFCDNKEELKNHLEWGQSVAWGKMGDTGSEKYTTHEMNWNEENYWYGYFRAMEDTYAWFFEDETIVI